MGEEIENMWVRLSLKSDEFKAGITEARGVLTNWRDETNSNTVEMAKWGAAFTRTVAPALAMGAVMLAAAGNAGRFGKEIQDNARDLGLSTTEFQRWTHAAIATGSSASEITESIRQMSVRMKDASDPASEIGKQLQALGVSAVDPRGKLRSMNDVLLDIIPALNKLPSGFDRNQASMAIFGRSFSNIADLTALSRQELQKLLDQAPVFSDERINQLDDYNTRMQLLNEKLQILNVEFGEKLVPVIENSLVPALEAAAPAISDLITLMDYLGEAVDRAATGYAMLRDPANWEKIAGGLNARQAARDWSREWGDELGKVNPNVKAMKGIFPEGKLPPSGGLVSLDVDTTAQKKLTDATNDYVKSLKAVSDELEHRNNLKRNYLENIQFAGNDIGQIRSLTLGYKQSLRNENQQISDAMGKAQGAGSAMIGVGKAGDIIIGPVTITASKDYPMSAVIKDLKALGINKNDLMQSGVRI